MSEEMSKEYQAWRGILVETTSAVERRAESVGERRWIWNKRGDQREKVTGYEEGERESLIRVYG